MEQASTKLGRSSGSLIVGTIHVSIRSFSDLPVFNSEHAAEKHGYNMERFIGHGVGTVLHSEPLI